MFYKENIFDKKCKESFCVGLGIGLISPLFLVIPYFRTLSGYFFLYWWLMPNGYGWHHNALGLLFIILMYVIIAILGASRLILGFNNTKSNKSKDRITKVYGILSYTPFTILVFSYFRYYIDKTRANKISTSNYTNISDFSIGFWINLFFAIILFIQAIKFKKEYGW